MILLNKLLKFEEKTNFFQTLGLIIGIIFSFHFWLTDQKDLIFGSVMGLATSCYTALGYLLLSPSKNPSNREISIKNGLSIIICISSITCFILKVF